MFEMDLSGHEETVNVVELPLGDKETVLRRAAAALYSQQPQTFEGLNPCVYFKLEYVPPCERFQGLRKLILRVREATGPRADFRGVVAIEVTGWLGHEREEYFTAFLKYLADNAQTWRTVLVVDQTPRLQRLLCAVASCLTVRVHRLRPDPMAVLEAALEQPLTPGCRRLLAPWVEGLSPDILERVARELSSGGAVSEQRAAQYLRQADSTLVLLGGNRRIEYEKAV